MAFSVTCSICGRQFVGIDDALLGQQAKCKCGETVTLDPLWNEGGRKVQVVAKAGTGKKKTSRKKAGPAGTSSRSSGAQSKNRPRQNAGAKPSSHQSKRKARPKSKQQTIPGDARKAEAKPRAAVQARPAATHATAKKHSQARQRTSTSAASLVESRHGAGQQPASPEREKELPIPATFDSFDIDEILAGGVDTSPLRPSPVQPMATATPDQQAEVAGEPEFETKRPAGKLGIAGSVVAGLSGFAAAALLTMTRFANFAGTPLGWIGQAFFGTHNGSFGSGEMSDRSISMFVGAGWVLTLLSVLIFVVSLILTVRVGFRVGTGRRVFGWSRPALATLGVICLFSLMGLLFVQSIHHGELLHGLLDFAGEPLEGLLPDETKDEPFKEIRDQYKQENQEFMIGVASFAVLPLLAFGGAVISLFFDEK